MAVWAVSTGALPKAAYQPPGASFLATGDSAAVYLDCRSESSFGFLVLTGYALGPGHRNTPAFPNCTSESNKERQWSKLGFARPSLVLLIRVPDTNPVQESPVIRRIDGRLCVRRIRRCRSETFSPTIRERFHRTNISAAPWTSPVNHEFMLRREADR